MIDYMMEIRREKRIEMLYAVMLPDNHRAIRLLKEMGLEYFISTEHGFHCTTSTCCPEIYTCLFW